MFPPPGPLGPGGPNMMFRHPPPPHIQQMMGQG